MAEQRAQLTAHSDDGRSFTIPDASGTPFIAGTLLLVATPHGRQLALVESRELTPAEGDAEALSGRLLGVVDGEGFDQRVGGPFSGGAVELADAATIDLVHAALGATLEVGVNLSPPTRPALLLAHRFNRHTFWCGQSGSGKTYALGVVLEQLIVDERADATVLDLGGFSTPDQHLVIALSVLDELWARRDERRPVLLVIDEAHNLCSPELASPLAVAVRDRIEQIAAEGRKFGLWLLLSTQRPSKVHPGIVSQCDNLALMKMSSPADLAGLATYFGSAPAELMARSPWFRQGEALFAGGFVPAPMLLSMNARLTPEGGSDVRVPLR